MQSAVTMCFGGVAGIIASTTFRTQDAPRYLPGSCVLSMILV